MSMLKACLPYALTLLPTIGGTGSSLLFNYQKDIKSWYRELKKPALQPPSWVFGPVWTSLYLSMGYASYLVYRDGVGEARNTALGIYAGQLALNWIWSPIFFKYHNLGLALIVSSAMLVGIGSSILTFKPINETAAYLMYPYFAWVSFATYLGFSLWVLNRKPKRT